MRMKLKKLLATYSCGLCLLATIALSPGTAKADLLIVVDLSVTDEVTISATNGLSAATASGSDFVGFYMENFYSVSGTDLIYSDGVGDLTNFENPSDGDPGIFRGSSGDDLGLNVWTFSSDATVTFTAGSQAFTGSATWDLTATEYAEMIADGNRSGDIYFPADTSGDVPGASLLGTYEVVIPTPAAMALLGVAGIAGTRRRRRG